MGAPLLPVTEVVELAVKAGVALAHVVREVRREPDHDARREAAAAAGEDPGPRAGEAFVHVLADAGPEVVRLLRGSGWKKGRPGESDAGGCWHPCDPNSSYREPKRTEPRRKGGKGAVLEWAAARLGYPSVGEMLDAPDLDDRLGAA